MKKIILFICLILIFNLNAEAVSVWQNSNQKGLFSDNKAAAVNDIVTIIIVESTNAVNKASTKLSKDSSVSGSVGTGYLEANLGWGSGSKDSFKGNGETTRENTLSGKITAQVQTVLPNGNLIIKGSRMVMLNKEKQRMVITGVIRPRDIMSDNSVLSTFVADAQIEYEGKGVVSEKANPGMFTRLLGWLYIF